MSTKYLCGVPKDCCNAPTVGTTNGLLKAIKAHSSSEEAFACHAHWLISQGFTKVGNREFKDPKTGYIRVLTKKSRFGSPMRKGKAGEKSSKSSRYNPRREGKFRNACGGTIIST